MKNDHEKASPTVKIKLCRSLIAPVSAIIALRAFPNLYNSRAFRTLITQNSNFPYQSWFARLWNFHSLVSQARFASNRISCRLFGCLLSVGSVIALFSVTHAGPKNCRKTAARHFMATQEKKTSFAMSPQTFNWKLAFVVKFKGVRSDKRTPWNHSKLRELY